MPIDAHRACRTTPALFFFFGHLDTFLLSEYILYSILMSSKKLFRRIIEFGFSTLDHDLSVFGTCSKYVLCSLDPGKSIGNNYSIIWVTKKILMQEKHIFQFCLKVTWMKLKIKNGRIFWQNLLFEGFSMKIVSFWLRKTSFTCLKLF